MKKISIVIATIISLFALLLCETRAEEKYSGEEVSLTFTWDSYDGLNLSKKDFVSTILIDTSYWDGLFRILWTQYYDYRKLGGYIIHYGTVSGNYDRMIIVSEKDINKEFPKVKITFRTSPGIRKYYFANETFGYYPFDNYDSDMALSGYSNEVVCTLK